jgi:hypothetical protein
MGKLLRVLVVIILLLSIGTLVLGSMLFKKRELLKGRTQKLENAIIAVGTTIEAGPAVLDKKQDYPARDTSPCTAEPIDNPEKSEFWKKYAAQLELQDQPSLDLAKRRAELMTYYEIDPASGEIMRDPATGYKLTTGKGTMQSVLDELLAKAEEQHNHLNETRQQLASIRAELVDTITDLNDKKALLRTALRDVKTAKDETEKMKGEIEPLKQQIKERDEEKRTLEDRAAEQRAKVAQLDEAGTEKEAEITRLKKEIEGLQGKPVKTEGAGPQAELKVSVEPGAKGKVITVNPKWNFVILQLSDEFLREIAPERPGMLPNIELMIKRGSRPSVFVTKVKLVHIQKSQKLAVANILTDWQQVPVEEGDVVFY